MITSVVLIVLYGMMVFLSKQYIETHFLHFRSCNDVLCDYRDEMTQANSRAKPSSAAFFSFCAGSPFTPACSQGRRSDKGKELSLEQTAKTALTRHYCLSASTLPDTTTTCTPTTYRPAWRAWWTSWPTAKTSWWTSWCRPSPSCRPSRSRKRSSTRRPWWDRWGRLQLDTPTLPWPSVGWNELCDTREPELTSVRS